MASRTNAAVAAATAAFVLLASALAAAAWRAHGAGAAATRAITLAVGPRPFASVDGTDVVVSWTPSGVPSGAPLGHRIRRYDGSGDVDVASGGCAGVVVATSCRESGVPAGTWRYALTPVLADWSGDEGPLADPVTITAPSPPVIDGATALKDLGGVAGRVRPGATFAVYANVAPSPTTGSAITSVRADASVLSAGSSAVALSTVGGPWTVSGTSYAWRSTQITVDAAAPASATITVTVADASGSTASAPLTVDVDATAPTIRDVQTRNTGTLGKPEAGDEVIFTFSESIDPASVIAGWDGTATAVVVRFIDGQTNPDSMSVVDAATGATLPTGTVTLARTDYVTGAVDFGSSGTASTIRAQGATLVVTLGTPSNPGRIPTPGSGTGTMRWTVRSGLWDLAGNACPVASVNETGAADREF